MRRSLVLLLALSAAVVASAVYAQAPVLSVEDAEPRVPPGLGFAEVWFRLSAPSSGRLLRACHNAPLEVDSLGSYRCRGRYAALIGSISRGEVRGMAHLAAGRYEVAAEPVSNIVRVTVTDECGWVGVDGPPPPRPGDVPVLAGASQPCNGALFAPTKLGAAGGGSFVLTSGVAEWISIWKDRGDKIPNVELLLGLTRQSGPVRARLRAGTPLSRHVIQAQTAAVLVVPRGQSDVEISHGARRTRVHVHRGQVALVPVPYGYPSSRFHLPTYVHSRCRGRPLMPCLARIRIRRGYFSGSRSERIERTVILRTGQTRVVLARGR